MNWIKEMFNVEKPIIAMCHLQALPGDPMYNDTCNMDRIVELARRDITSLQEGGVDGIIFSNEFSLPYLKHVEAITIAAMARIIGEIKPNIKLPYGINCMSDPIASIDLAAVTDASFIREVMTGIYSSDYGLWDTDVGKTVRHVYTRRLENKLKLFFNILPESAKYLGCRDLSDIICSTIFNTKADAMCVSGLTAGREIDISILKKIRMLDTKTALFCNTGCNKENISAILPLCDGVIIATSLKMDGKFENPIDKNRVSDFMKIVKYIR